MPASGFCVFAALLGGLWGLSQIKGAEAPEKLKVQLYPAMAWKAADGQAWIFDLHGLVCEPERRRLTVAVLRKSLGLEAGPLGDNAEAIFKERAKWFMVDDERGKKLTVRIGDRDFQLAPTKSNGHVAQQLRVPRDLMESWLKEAGVNSSSLEIRAWYGSDSNHAARGEVELLGGTGVSIISDIDDTIKISEVREHKALLRNTFFAPFRPVKGMPELYRGWASKGAQFHYVSASPWQLYPALAEFRAQEGFPAGTFHLKMFRLKDRSFLQLFASPEDYKWSVIAPMMKQFPNRRYVLVGDSGERDPEVYGRIARAFPNQVIEIYIRDVTGEGPGAERYQKAFAELPATKWRVFEEASEIDGNLPIAPGQTRPSGSRNPLGQGRFDK